jgi:CRP-like cAMP-binding protein
MPYKANSIIFFRGDRSDRIFILKSGQVSLNHTDIETGQEVHDLIKTGEFFGVKSALGRYARDETAQVLTDSTALAFSGGSTRRCRTSSVPRSRSSRKPVSTRSASTT